MLCFEGIALNLNVFMGNMKMPKFALQSPPGGELQTMTVKEEVGVRIMQVIAAI